jgi:hypothetical protein
MNCFEDPLHNEQITVTSICQEPSGGYKFQWRSRSRRALLLLVDTAAHRDGIATWKVK